MTRQEIIEELEVLKEPNRILDQELACLFNYRREKTTNGQRAVIVWYSPDGERLRVVPRFTESIDDARTLLDYALPNVASGCSWDENGAYAKAIVDGAEVTAAFNIATAICLVAIKSSEKKS